MAARGISRIYDQRVREEKESKRPAGICQLAQLETTARGGIDKNKALCAQLSDKHMLRWLRHCWSQAGLLCRVWCSSCVKLYTQKFTSSLCLNALV